MGGPWASWAGRLGLPGWRGCLSVEQHLNRVSCVLPCSPLLLPCRIYTQMSKTLGKVFFPSNDPIMQALSFWGV